MNPGREAADRNQLFARLLVAIGTFSERNDYKETQSMEGVGQSLCQKTSRMGWFPQIF